MNKKLYTEHTTYMDILLRSPYHTYLYIPMDSPPSRAPHNGLKNKPNHPRMRISHLLDFRSVSSLRTFSLVNLPRI
jgi:hypothetical protein